MKIPTPYDLQIAHNKAQQPDPVKTQAALERIVRELTKGYPARVEFIFSPGRYNKTEGPWLTKGMLGQIEKALHASGWSVGVAATVGFQITVTPCRCESCAGGPF